jgi:hypothetical protein
VPAFKLQKESEKKNECAIDGEEFVFLFALRALCLRLSFQRKARKKNECAIDGEEKKFCASRLFHAPKVQRQSVKKNIAQSMVAGTVQIKKNTTSAFSLCATRQECALSFSFTFSFIAFICVLRLCAFPFVIGSSIVFS